MDEIIDTLVGAAAIVPAGYRVLWRTDLYRFENLVKVAAAGVAQIAATLLTSQPGGKAELIEPARRTAFRVSFIDPKCRMRA